MEFFAFAVGLGFLVALIGTVKAKAWNAMGMKVQFVDLAIPFAQRWALYSAAVGVAMLMSYGLAQLPR